MWVSSFLDLDDGVNHPPHPVSPFITGRDPEIGESSRRSSLTYAHTDSTSINEKFPFTVTHDSRSTLLF